ncbi:glycerol-3-phosphate acyltransferase [Mycoplasma nasistruthionis]|uniref:glycerol-3-phosphate acyltransferase n=1 Tax=Mycoplasma nasistruthionis TaxID=353852 RepID=UPI001FE665C5|nr:glycerol-3-phosphate acyltransferase [Mycoplasma nasistruthionis]
MNAFNSVLFNIFLVVFGYIIGSLNTSIIVGKILKKDPRDYHSKNAGATNSLRVFGKKIAIMILMIDVIKTISVVAIGYGLTYWCNLATSIDQNGSVVGVYGIGLPPYWEGLRTIYGLPLLAGLGTVIGHIFPIFFGFKGGKGVASSLGLLISYNIIFLPIAAVFFFGLIFEKDMFHLHHCLLQALW